MQKRKDPAALAGAARANISADNAGIDITFAEAAPAFAAAWIARRFRVSPMRARLICELANIGGEVRR